MASHSFLPLISLIMFLISFSTAFTEIYNPSSMSSDMVVCGPRLLALTACAPFVQGSVPKPARLCCRNLIDLYYQLPNCVCFLLNETTAFTSFPIIRILALQLPDLCKVKLNTSICSGPSFSSSSPESQVSQGNSSPASSPETQVSHETSFNSSSPADPPMVLTTPKMNFGFRIHHSAGQKLTIKRGPFIVVATAFLWLQVFIWF